MAARALPTGTVTLLFTDIEGSTRLLQELGRDCYMRSLSDQRRLLRQAFTDHGGVEVEMQGDSFHFAFQHAVDALLAAADAQGALADHEWETGAIRVRIGIHTGEPAPHEGLYAGIDVHRAARIMSAGHGGQVLLSESTRALLAELPDGLVLRDLGEHRLKDLTSLQRLYQLGHEEFPPLRTLEATNLPVAASPLLGRKKELEELLALLRSGTRLLTVTGPGGSGKTRLALQVAAELVGSYRDGVFWVPLAALNDPDLVLPQVAQALGTRDELADHLRDREMLVLADNFEHLLGAAPQLAELLGGAKGLRLLVTSRAALHVRGERAYPLDPLAPGDAVTLFVERARESGRELAADETVDAICRRLDGLPLAVELAAARTRLLAPATLLERLSSALPLLTGGARDAPDRQRTLRATIEWSYELLSAEERQLFRRLSVFVGGSTLEAAEEVCGADLDTLQSLVEKSLVRFVNGRYWMLETIREYARERHDEDSCRQESAARHASWLARLVEQGESELEGPTQNAWLDRLEREHDNIRAALQWALDCSDADLALRLAAASATFWWIHGHWTEGRRWLEAALSRSGSQYPALRAKALEGASNLASRQLDYARAKELADEGLALCRDLRDGSRTARMLRVRALACGAGDDEGFRALVEQSAEAAREAGDAWALLMALNNLGYLALAAGDAVGAISMFDQALQIARTHGDRRSEAFLLENLALAKFERGMLEEAGDDFATSLRLAHHLGFVEVAAVDLMGIAALAAAAGELDLAACLLAGAQHLNEEIGARLDAVETGLEARTVSAIERSLDPETHAEAVIRGRAQSVDELVELALGVIH
jgi:predicted ATPase/class 3 adenylate cyclase